VKFSIERAQSEASDFKKRVKSITSVEIIDEYTVKFVTSAPNPILPNEITSVFIMDKEWSEANNVTTPQDFDASEETFAVRNANGTGPFQLVSRAPDELTVMVRNADWWGNSVFPGNVDKIEFRPVVNASTRVAGLLSGEFDFVLDPSVQDVKRIAATDGLKVTTTPQIRSIFFGMNQGSDELASSNIKGANPFKDQRVRMAMNLAIDKEAIQRVIMNGLSSPTGLIAPPGVLGVTDELDASYGFDLEKAKILMIEAGYADGFSLQLDCPNNRYVNDSKICQAAVAMLAKIGVTVNLEATPKAQHFPKIKGRTTDFYLLGWGVPTMDSHYVFDFLLESGGSWNASGYSDARVDELVDAIGSEIDGTKRAAMIDEVWSIAKAAVPYVPIHHQVLSWAQQMRSKCQFPSITNSAHAIRS
jgi:peptide/nickel transport system substrate-binding protein